METTTKYRRPLPKPTLQLQQRFWRKADTSDISTCWKWLGRFFATGYGIFSVSGHPYKAHRVAYLFTFNFDPVNYDVLHHCDNPACVNPDHLFLGTHADNMQDRKARGRAPSLKGELNGRAKLTAEQVRSIRQRHRRNVKGSTNQLAAEFSVSPQLIRRIASNQCWQSVS